MLLALVASLVALVAALWWGGREAAARRRLEATCADLEAEIARQAAEHEADSDELKAMLARVESVQDQLVESKKMASLGQLTAGVAHEIKNPLNFINNFAQLSVELATDLRDELEEDQTRTVGEALGDIGDLLDDIEGNAEKIKEHGTRADRIVRNMLMHARTSNGNHQPVDLNGLLVEYANLAYHGTRASDSHFNVRFEQDLGPDVGEVAVVPQEIGRVFINLLNNAFYAVSQRKENEKGFEPVVTLATRSLGDTVEVQVADNGVGIPDDVVERIFEPFFTTKPTGSGTGLGLSLSHEIVTQRHRGTMDAESVEGKGTTFRITLPREVERDG